MKPVVQNDVYARQVYELYWDSYLKGDKDTFVSTLDEVFEMNGAPKSEVCEHNFQGLGFLKAQIQGALEKLEMRNREINLVPINSLFLVRECCEIHVLRAETWSFHSKIRISSLIRETASGWKMVQQNVSFPQLSNEDGETKASEILSAENKKLTNLLQRQTTELEQKKRELEIEAALEKVRGRTMVMQDSDELENVATLLFQQVRELGIETWTTGFNVWNEYDTAYTDFVTNPEGGFIKPYVVDLTQFQTFIEIREAKLRGEDFFVRLEEGDAIKETYEHLMCYAPEQYGKLLEQGFDFPLQQYEHFVFGKTISLMFITYKPVPEAHDVFRRFGKVFEQTYTRFLDLQKAEAQAKEARIEGALERVRSQSMAMQKSEDLLKVITVVSEQLKSLNFKFNTVSFAVPNQVHDYKFWFAIMGNPNPIYIQVPYIKNPMFDRMKEVLAEGREFYADTLTPEESLSWHEHVFAHSDMPAMSDETKAYILRSAYARSIAILPRIMLILSNYAGKPYSEQENEIIKRFACVFEQSYTRFLDLQKAEDQAREAQIEAALERVRSKAMAMHKSEELHGVIQLVYEQLVRLNVRIHQTGFVIDYKKSDDWNLWMTDFIQPIPIFIHFLYFDHPMFDLFKDAKARALDFSTINLTQSEKNRLVEEGYKYNPGVPNDIKEAIFSSPGYAMSASLHENIVLFVANFDGIPLTEQENDVIRKFGKAFEQTYTRFLDLQKAEAQARESQIEAALERVRSTSLAMHHSDELEKVVLVVYEQLVELGLVFDGTLIFIFDSDKRHITLWIATNRQPAPLKINLPYEADMKDNSIFRDLWHAIDKNESNLNKTYTGKGKDDYFRYVGRHNSENIPQAERQLLIDLPSWTMSYVAEKNSVLAIDSWSGKFISNDDFNIMKRFAVVFEQAYTRFIDLQKAEAQAREAMIEVALERIRAKALAMQTSDELIEVAKVLREQMGLLGQEDLEASVVHLYYPDSPVFDSWYAIRPIGKDSKEMISGIATFKIDNSQLAREFLELYEDPKTEYSLEVQGEKQKEWLGEIRRNAPAVAAYWGDLPPEKQYYHFSDFSGGALLMVSFKTLSEETKMLQKRCSAVFELAYKRFQDLRLKEKQAKALLDEKQRLEKALEKLKSTQAQLIQSEKMASLGELTAGIAHEIQNPLNFVNNFSEVSAELVEELKGERSKVEGDRDESLEDEILGDIKLNLEKITHHGKRADAIVKGMLEHSRASSGDKVLTDINALADEYLRLSYHGMRAKNKSFSVEYETHFDPDLPKVNVVPQDIGRVLLNIINNAFQAFNEKDLPGFLDDNKRNLEGLRPIVAVSTKNLGDKIEISVKDNGPGIPDAIKDKIFQPFFTTKPTGQGTGLGLSLSYDIVKAHGGELKVETQEGIGSHFIIILPKS